MMNKISLVIHFIVSVVVAYFFASIFQTQMVIAGLTNINVKVELSDRLSMTIQDLSGLLISYGSIVLAGLLIAFLVAKAIKKFSPIKNNYLYVIAGAVAMLVILLAMQPVMGVTLLAGARSTTGVLLQMLAGVIGGYTFVQFRSRAARSRSSEKFD